MRFFFRRSNSGTTTLDLPLTPEEPRQEAAAEGSPEPATEEASTDSSREPAVEPVAADPPPDTALIAEMRDLAFAPEKKLVLASELPSASDVLAELFAEEPTPPSRTDVPPTSSSFPAPTSTGAEQSVREPAQHKIVGAAKPPKPSSDASGSGNAPVLLTATVASKKEKPAAAIVEPVREPIAKPAPPLLKSIAQEAILPVATAQKPAAAEPPGTVGPAEAQTPPDNRELCAEDAATVLAAASEEIVAEDAPASPTSKDDKTSPASGKVQRGALSSASSNWQLEEVLASHREWVDSKGVNGAKADLGNAQLDGTELINVNLRLADLHYADLKGTDLLLADLRDACMVRADLEEACLVGANLEGANLEGASLQTALGLVPRQLAGTNLREAQLPPQIAQFPALNIFRNAARAAMRFFVAIITLSALSALAIWKTKDIQLLTDAAILPFLHSARAAAALPSAEIFLITPVALFLLYLAFLAQIQKAWGAVLELPAVFPDGRSLGEKEPGIILGLLRAQFRWMNHEATSGRTLETTLSLLAAYWTVPALLFLFWARYLTLQEIHGTVLHEVLACAAAGIALHATFKVGRPQERWTMRGTFSAKIAERLRGSRPPVFVAALLAIATFFSFGTIWGVPHDRSRAPQFGTAHIRRWAPTALWSVGYDPYADLTEASVSRPPANWNGSDEQLGAVRGVRLNNPVFRYAQAYGAFFANAHLWHADFRGAYLSDSDFRNADLTQGNLRYAVMDGARMNHVNLDRGILSDAHLARTDFRDANLSYASLQNSFLMDARFDGASLYNATLANAAMVRTTFERADLRNSHLDNATLEHADFRQTYLWSASLVNADLKDAELGSAILIGANLRGANLGGAHFAQTVLNETDLSGAALDGADLRGAFGLTAAQICSARSHANALLDDALAPQVMAQCGAR